MGTYWGIFLTPVKNIGGIGLTCKVGLGCNIRFPNKQPYL